MYLLAKATMSALVSFDMRSSAVTSSVQSVPFTNGLNKHIGTNAIVFQLLYLVFLEVIDVGLQHIFIKVTGFQFGYFAQDKSFTSSRVCPSLVRPCMMKAQ